ncbi:type IX secretion system anionic LPS delivery protein PorZ [Pontibacter oryzae]|uniref:PorZ N-terminal beta-propeller domain-containing protein n=1 Tax=Pontibacter oryzae TaxID=2304593 RepID=A0A399S0B9_9BACT|nr:hypothetical protein [Pontibacter oryzae]RIJ36671.1 hypothetical protein D1627_12560 [Pontibacter oryzae]
MKAKHAIQIQALKYLPYLLLAWMLCGNFAAVQAQSQVPIGGWQVHVPYQRGKAVALAGDLVYVAAEQGLFYYDKEFNTTEALTKVDGLSEQQISDIAYDETTRTLVIAYQSTKVDLLRDNKVYSITDIFRKSIPGEKKINSLYIHNKLAYLSCSFGIVVLDLQKREVKDTYSNLGPNGEAISATATAILQGKVYAATNYGILSAPVSGANLQDFQSWSNQSKGLPGTTEISGLAVFQEQLYCSTPNAVYTLQNGKWQNTLLASGSVVQSIHATPAALSITTTTGLTVLDAKGQKHTVAHPLLAQPRKAAAETDGSLWVADNSKGLVKASFLSGQATAHAPNGPYASNSFGVYTYGGAVYVLSGGYNESYLQSGITDGFYKYENGTWQNFNRELNPASAVGGAQDLVSAVYNPVTKKLYFGSYHTGLIEWESPEQGKVYNGLNSPLLSAAGPSTQTDYVRVTDVDVDAEGNVWAVNRNQQTAAPGLFKLQPDGTWQSYTLPNLVDGSNLTYIVIDDFGQKWLSIARRRNSRSGVVVYDDVQNRLRILSTGDRNGGLPDGMVYSMAKDLNGDIWVGTASGVGVYYNPAFAFDSNPYDARIPIIDGRPLLAGQTVRSIAVDGANRKWMGTDNGLWLFGPDGDKLIHHFTAQNSPLPSDKVYAVGVEHQSGEVFVATEAGVASFRSDATRTEGKPACAMVFPNPVQRDFTGQVGISGLPNHANVRITDVAGNLVYKAKATGGTLAWNARDYNGNRVKAGVYLVLSASEDGNQTCITKIAVLE